MPKEQWYVEIVGSIDSDAAKQGEVVERLGPKGSERMAEKVERGVLRNMDTDRFFTRVVLDK